MLRTAISRSLTLTSLRAGAGAAAATGSSSSSISRAIDLQLLPPFLPTRRPVAVPPPSQSHVVAYFSTSTVVREEASKDASSSSKSDSHGDEEEALLQRLKDELKAAMKGRQTDVVGVLKSLLSEHQLASKTTAGSVAVSIVSLLRKAIARRTEAAQQYSNAKREDLADKEKGEVSLLERFLPKQMQDEEMRSLVHQAVQAARGQGVDGKKLMGTVIREVKAKAGGRVDGSTLKGVVEDVIKRFEGK